MYFRFQILLLFAITVSSCGSGNQISEREFTVENLQRTELDDQEFELSFKASGLAEEIKLEYLYFENKKARVVKSSEGLYSAKFSALKWNSEDRILSVDMSEESNNTLPQLPVKPPVVINKTQALLSYTVGSEIKYKVLNFKTN